MNLITQNRYFLYETVLIATVSNNSATTPFSLLVITNGRQEVHARTLTSVCKSGICALSTFPSIVAA